MSMYNIELEKYQGQMYPPNMCNLSNTNHSLN